MDFSASRNKLKLLQTNILLEVGNFLIIFISTILKVNFVEPKDIIVWKRMIEIYLFSS